MLTGDSYQPSRDQWHRQCNVLALLAADTSVEYSSSANPRTALSVNIRIFSAPFIEGPPNIMGTLYLHYEGYTFIIRGIPNQYFN